MYFLDFNFNIFARNNYKYTCPITSHIEPPFCDLLNVNIGLIRSNYVEMKD